MTPSWRTVERELIDLLRSHHFHIKVTDGEVFIRLDAYDFPQEFSLSTFAKELAQRLEKVR